MDQVKWTKDHVDRNGLFLEYMVHGTQYSGSNGETGWKIRIQPNTGGEYRNFWVVGQGFYRLIAEIDSLTRSEMQLTVEEVQVDDEPLKEPILTAISTWTKAA